LTLKTSAADNCAYQDKSLDYEERLASTVDVALPIAAATRDEALLLCAVILRGRKAPKQKQIVDVLRTAPTSAEHVGIVCR
jgi:hypothetical protein